MGTRPTEPNPKNSAKYGHGDEEVQDLVTERDTDPEFGLFKEESFPQALKDKDQKAAMEHAIPRENQLHKPS
ncbi:hypothetical protein Q5741_12020 [Paenibacillus sp. JX-17]|uniref:YfhD family protein n=1 Tax=Paenibacillus lacisoli TaxID=3064525 RepID=A0ABT9CHI9_9BACL|nr:hypothetical protein [Paenibacillus sp. JX-17]MDO7907136.1 hypothetical protein [Paenibacillus sp. JX-17]